MNILCHAYCLMGNHYHLLLETPDANLSLAVRQLNGAYAQAFNRRHSRVGHLFQGRFNSRLVAKETYLLVVSRYIVLNPVRAGLTPEPADWKWSSYLAQAGRVEPPSFLSVDWLLSRFDANDRNNAQAEYTAFVREALGAPGPSFRDKPILGSRDFVAKFRNELRGAAPLKDIPRIQRFAARPMLREIFAGCQERHDRNIRIRKAHIDHGYTMTEIASHLELHVMTVSRAIRKC
jgi:hypothetical protein